MCENCISFKDLYFFEPLTILEEALAAQKIIDSTDEKRMHRAEYEVKRTTNIVKEINGVKKNLYKMEWNNRAEPSSEQRNHAGYIIYDDEDPKKMIYELFCDCQDFFLRNWYTFNKLGMTPWILEPKYEKRNVLRAQAGGFLRHNKQKQKYTRTNKEQKIGCCKHLANVIFFYILGDLKPSDVKKIEHSKKLEKEPKKEIKVAPKTDIIIPPKVKSKDKSKESNPSKTPEKSKGITKPTKTALRVPEKAIKPPLQPQKPLNGPKIPEPIKKIPEPPKKSLLLPTATGPEKKAPILQPIRK